MEEKFKEFHSLLGSKLKYKIAFGEFEGILQHLTPRLLMMEHVYRLPSRDYLGNLNYRLSEILSYTVTESKDTIRKYERFDYLVDVVYRAYNKTSAYDVMDVLLNGELDDPICSDEETVYEEDIEFEEFVLKLPPELQNSLPMDSIILDAVNTDFHQAISYILKQKLVGVSFEGSMISRSGKLSWICVSTDACIFLFDIEILKGKAFDQGLRNIFQNKNIVKVIHDCRKASDCLNHVYSTEITNVFDTQVADYVITMQRYTGKHNLKYVSSLDCCLISYLDVPQEYLRNHRTDLSYEGEDNFFAMRPITNEYRNMAIKNAVYLVLLKEKLEKLLLEPFYKTVDIYLNILSKASEAELLLNLSAPDTIPPAVLMKGIQTVRFQEIPTEDSVVSLECKFQDPITGKVINSYESLKTDLPKSSSVSKCIKNDERKEKIKKGHKSSIDNDKDINSHASSDSSKNIKPIKNSNICNENRIEKIKKIIRSRGKNANSPPIENEISNKIESSSGKNENSPPLENRISNKVDCSKGKNKNSPPVKSRISNKNSNVIQCPQSNPSANDSVIVNEMTVRSSSRQVDRIFYKLVNSHYGADQAPCNLIDVKPSSDYVSTFVQRKPFASVNIENCSSFGTDHALSSKSPDNMEEVWSRLREEFRSDETYEHPKNFKIVPAGMS